MFNTPPTANWITKAAALDVWEADENWVLMLTDGTRRTLEDHWLGKVVNLPCLRCDCEEEFEIVPNAVIEQVYRGQTFQIETEASACPRCGWITVTIAQANLLYLKMKKALRQGETLD